ncbi:hypothetical protein AgCh_003494 [Apium graveolens]
MLRIRQKREEILSNDYQVCPRIMKKVNQDVTASRDQIASYDGNRNETGGENRSETGGKTKNQVTTHRPKHALRIKVQIGEKNQAQENGETVRKNNRQLG